MRQPRRPDDVTRGINALYVGLIIIAHLHVVAVEFDLHRIGDHTFDIRHDADGGEHHLGLDFLLLVTRDEIDFDRVLADAEILALRSRENRDALFLQGPLQHLRHLFVFDGQHLVEHLDERHLRAKRIVEIRELHTDRPRADNHDGLRQRGIRERLARGHHAHAIDGQLGDTAHFATGRDERVLRLEKFPLMLALGDLDHAGRDDPRLTGVILDLVLLEQKLDALGHLSGHAA